MAEKTGSESPPPYCEEEEKYPPQLGYTPDQGYPKVVEGVVTQSGYMPVPQDNPGIVQGYPVAPQPGYGLQQQQSTIVITQQPDTLRNTEPVAQLPGDYLCASIMACICCFWPAAIFAIYFACRRDTLLSEGKITEATQMARYARQMIIASVIFGIICSVTYFLIINLSGYSYLSL